MELSAHNAAGARTRGSNASGRLIVGKTTRQVKSYLVGDLASALSTNQVEALISGDSVVATTGY